MGELWNGLLLGLGQLLAFFYDFIPSYGVAIILLTVLVRIALVPLAIRQVRFQAEMKQKAPQMRKFQEEYKKIQQKHAGDRQKVYEEASKLQAEMGVNPMGQLLGCMPMLLQMPIFFAMYKVLAGCPKGQMINKIACKAGFGGTLYLPAGSALRAAIIAGQAGFLGMNLGQSAMQVFRADGILSSAPYFALVAIMAVANWYSTKQMQASAPDDPQTQQMQKMLKFMPLLFAFWSVNFPAGLTLYWTTFNLWVLGQQWVLTKQFKIGEVAPAGPSPKSAPAAAVMPIQKSGGLRSTVKGLLGGGSAPVNGSGSATASDKSKTTAEAANGARPLNPKPKGSGARKRKKKKKR